MQISIIIPIYKVEKYIERCINSVVMQAFTDYEVILVDDASPDNAFQIAERLLKENNIVFQTIKHETNKGLAEARNSGIKVAQGKYLIFIDSDDNLPSKKVLQWFYNAIQENDYDFVTARVNIFESGESSPLYRKHFKEQKILENTQILKVWMQHFITNEAWNKLIRADFIYKNQLFFQKGYYYEDLPWAFDLYRKAKKACVLPKFTYNYYYKLNRNAITSNVTKEKISHLAQHIKYVIYEIEKDSVLKKSLSKKYIHRLVMRNINFILYDSEVIKNKNIWLFAYKTFRKVYRNSFLWKSKKQLFLPDLIAYYVIRKPIEEDFELQNIFLKLFVKRIFPLNFQIEEELIDN